MLWIVQSLFRLFEGRLVENAKCPTGANKYFQALGSKQIDKVIELVHDEAKFIILDRLSSQVR
ncbi:hypothetical protein ACFQ5D_08135 [Paenibacillus farraposensis]|uniref:Uncharacterized protein n=1 Tax=Paenibacillus farraposensis TaxID=2807095 RepID=A0ABW4DC17_9BACL|nr:hypothetical protein [Paenibacillus farraposensis]MCC3380267.1 hypothetical protein [Paenibacillus farraposensis]